MLSFSMEVVMTFYQKYGLRNIGLPEAPVLDGRHVTMSSSLCLLAGFNQRESIE